MAPTTPPVQPGVPRDDDADDGNGNGGATPPDETVAADTEPQFSPDVLAGIAFVLFLAVLVAVLLVVNDPTTTGHTSTVTTTTTKAGTTSTETVKQVLRTPFATDMARILALVGVATIAMGAWLQAASLRKWRVPVAKRTKQDGKVEVSAFSLPIADILKPVGDAFAKLKAPVALVFAGFALLLSAAWIAVETLPARAAPAEATTDDPSDSASDPAASPGPTDTPTAPAGATPTGGPATGDDPLPTSTPTG